MLAMFRAKKKAAEESEEEAEVSEEEEEEAPVKGGRPNSSGSGGGKGAEKGQYDLDVEADGDDPATAASVVAALYAKYKKNVSRPSSYFCLLSFRPPPRPSMGRAPPFGVSTGDGEPGR
jgi:hypothetical protein